MPSHGYLPRENKLSPRKDVLPTVCCTTLKSHLLQQLTGSTCVVQCYNNKSNHRAGISLHRSPADPQWKKVNVRTHTQCEFQPERHFDHFTDEFFQRAVHVEGSQRSIIALPIPTIWKKEPEKTLSVRTIQKVPNLVTQFK